jgi:alcohol dehydrogenase class IV
MKYLSQVFPGHIHFGYGALSELETVELEGKRAMIVTGGKSMENNGFTGAVKKFLTKRGVEPFVFNGVEPEVSVDTVDKACNFARKNKIDTFIGLGGGSAIDCAKAVAGIYKGKAGARDYLDGRAKIEWETGFLTAIPSTAGTGSEVTKNAVLTYPERNNKISLRGEGLVPDAVIADPELTVSMPPEITAHSGLDALSHAVESYFSTAADGHTMQLSAFAVQCIFENLPAAFENGRDRQARYNMLLASVTAGLAFSKAGLGAVHGIGHTVGAVCGIPHGLVNAILLPHVEEFNEPAIKDRIKELEKTTGKGFLKKLRSLNKKLGIPLKLSKACSGIADRMDIIVRNISYTGSMAYNPVKMDAKKIEAILKGAV